MKTGSVALFSDHGTKCGSATQPRSGSKYLHINFVTIVRNMISNADNESIKVQRKRVRGEVKPLQLSARFDPVNCALVKPRVY